MATELISSTRLKIVDVVGDGFFGINQNNNKALVKDKFALKNNGYKIGDVVEVNIELVDEKDVRKEKKGKEFYCAINDFTNNGFYTKNYKEYENWKRLFLYESRGMMTFLNDYNRFNLNDIIKVKIRRIK